MMDTGNVVGNILGKGKNMKMNVRKNNEEENERTKFLAEKQQDGTASKEESEEYFLGKDPRKHKDYKHFLGR